VAKRNKLPELEREYGNLEAVIPPLVNQFDQKYAANQLSTSQATISRWLKNSGYSKKITWVKGGKHE